MKKILFLFFTLLIVTSMILTSCDVSVTVKQDDPSQGDQSPSNEDENDNANPSDTTNEDTSGDTNEDNSGDTNEDNSGNTNEDNSGDTNEDNSGDTNEDNSGNTNEDNSGDTNEDNSGNTNEDNSGDTNEDNSGDTNEDNSGDTNEDNTGNNTENNDDSGNTQQPPACTHSYETEVIPMTLTSQGYLTKSCTLCPDSYLSLQYDDYVTSLGAIAAVSETAVIEGTALEILAVGTTHYFHAKEIGEAVLSDGELSYRIVVEKAKINLIVIMGQSNSVSWTHQLFEGALSDISSPLGASYLWKKNSTAPSNYTQTTRGFHSTLLAELYAQSLAAGEPVKNVLVWEDGVTSTSGQSITGWASETAVTQDTLDTVTMTKACASYYTSSQNRSKYEIVSRGMYWLQGEIDGSTETPDHEPMNPATYEACFMKMWRELRKAGLKYVAFLRVRGDVADNQTPNADTPDHNDIDYTTSLAAQLKMIAENDNFYLATSLTEDWVGADDSEHTVKIENYITLMNYYSGGERFEDEYGNVATYADGTLTTSMPELFGSINYCHYGKFGFTLIGADAAYNMYRALNGESITIEHGDTSGKSLGAVTIPATEPTLTISITEQTEDLTFRAATGTTAGTLAVTVMSGETDITELVKITEGAHLGAINTETLKNYENVKITVTYTPTSGTVASVTYTVQNEIL